ncbi:putative chitinase [Mucilaginibacter rubeus]|jgi:predicted chitinase|uniref:glycoside hydrolase family 19 protein n=1 Tax=Mucilaginibacter TaxID=423349 RepID=UPI00339A796D
MPGTKEFYDTIRASVFKGHISQSQIDGIEAILKAAADAGVTDQRKVAYMLGTVYHECAGTMQPINEFGKGKGHPYGEKFKMGGGPGHRIPYTTPDQLYYGRGFVQLTWYENYDAMGKHLHLDLLNHPELALQPDIAANIMIEGMTKGMFTGVGLGKYFDATHADWINARRIINGNDHDVLIAGYAKHFYKGLTGIDA